MVVEEYPGGRLAAFGKTIGKVTNNVAEYTAVIEALRWLRNHPITQSSNHPTQFFLDSTLVANQLMGRFKVKDPTLRLLLFEIRQLESEIGGSILYTAVRREQNAAADTLVNEALDRELMSSSVVGVRKD